MLGRVIPLTPGVSITLLPSTMCAPAPDAQAMIEGVFAHRIAAQPNLAIKDGGRAAAGATPGFTWAALPPGQRPDTVIIRGLPFHVFGLTPATLQRHYVASGASLLRKALAEFGVRGPPTRTPSAMGCSACLYSRCVLVSAGVRWCGTSTCGGSTGRPSAANRVRVVRCGNGCGSRQTRRRRRRSKRRALRK